MTTETTTETDEVALAKMIAELTVPEIEKYLRDRGIIAGSQDVIRAFRHPDKDEDELRKMPRQNPLTKAELVELAVKVETVAQQIKASLPEREPEPEPEAEPEPEPELDQESIAAVHAHTRALALREEAVVQEAALLPTVGEFQAMREMAEAIASTEMVPKAFRGKKDDVLAAILTGREMGLGPMQSLRDLYVIDGKPSLAAHLLLAQLRKGGVQIIASEATPERAWIKAKRTDTGEECEVEFTYADAQAAGLTTKNNWKNYPADMNWARCVGRLARRLGPDLIGNALPYTSEEVQDWESYESQTSSPAAARDNWDAPDGWAALAVRLTAALGEHESPVWMEEIAQKGYQQASIADVVRTVDDDRKRDLWQRLLRILRNLESEGDLTFATGHRQTVQEIIAKAFDGAIQVDGPTWSLQPDEGADRPSVYEVLGIEPPAGPTGNLGAEVVEDAEFTPLEDESESAEDVPTAAESEEFAATQRNAEVVEDEIKF